VFRVSRVVSKLNHSVGGTHIRLAVSVLFRFSSLMIRCNKTDSKLCASMTRHANGSSPRLLADGSTCKGGFAPRCIPRYYAGEAHCHA